MHQHLGQLGNNKHIPNGDTATQLLCWDIWLLSIRFILSNYSNRYYICHILVHLRGNERHMHSEVLSSGKAANLYVLENHGMTAILSCILIYIYIFCMQLTNSVLLKDIQRLSICICFNTAACLLLHHDTRSTCSTNQSIPPTLIEVQKGP